MKAVSRKRGGRAAPGDCPYCNGAGVVCGNADDVAFEIQCACKGGEEEAVRWLLGRPPSSDGESAPPRKPGRKKR